MKIDSYAYCPCGSGTKQKWCQSKAGLSQIPKILSMLENHQTELALAAIDRLIEDRSHSECFHVFARVLKGQALEQFERFDEAKAFDAETLNNYPSYGLVWEQRGDHFLNVNDWDAAQDSLEQALERYPPAAIPSISRCLSKLAAVHLNEGRFLAAWAAWQRKLKNDPESESAEQDIHDAIRDNPFLPHRVRHGLTLKSADEFTLFDEDQAVRWEKALAEGQQLHLKDLAKAFREVVESDPKNAAGWYNLAVSLAWLGDHAGAIEALSKYVDFETDVNEAADAWDLAELLRFGSGAEAVADEHIFVAIYRMADPAGFQKTFVESNRFVILQSADKSSSRIFLLDKVNEAPTEGIPILGGPPRPIAELRSAQGQMLLMSSSLGAFQTAKKEMGTLFGDILDLLHESETGCPLESAYAEPITNSLVLAVLRRQPFDAVEESRRYYEEIWLHRPLKSLAGNAPIDAAHSPKLRKRLEGVIRFHERLLSVRNIRYNIDRLRNKLGLPISGSGVGEADDPARASKDVDLSAYSAQQLAALNPEGLSDDDLVTAYRTALSLDAPQTANNFAEVIIRRDAAAEKIDVNTVFRRLIQDRLAQRDLPKAEGLIAQGRAFDSKHYQGREMATFDLLAARAAIYAGRQDEALSTLRELPNKYPARLDVTASAIESLLSSGHYLEAKDLAQAGLERAQNDRNGDLQAQFREYLEVAAERV